MSTERCLDENTLLQLVEGILPAAAQGRVKAHLKGCASCRSLIVGYGVVTEARDPSLDALTASLVDDGETGPVELVRGALLGRYVVLDRIGRGGMGVVYAAYDPELNRRVAIKLHRTDDEEALPQARARLQREARSMARLSHPNVVAVHDVGEADGQIFVAMDLVEGMNLRRWLDEEKRSPEAILDVFRMAGRGLAAAHAAGIVHRDFKPENVLVGKDGRVVVTDFGLARPERAVSTGRLPVMTESTVADPVTLTGSLMGTPAYMAPEQLDGKPADPRTDQFSFCVALHEALTGVRPFRGRSTGELRDAMRLPLDLSLVGNLVDARTLRALETGLQRDPEARHPGMDALLTALTPPPPTRNALTPIFVVAGLVLAAGVGLVVNDRQSRVARCEQANGQLAGIWDAAVADDVGRAFQSASPALATVALQGIRKQLDAFRSDWVSTWKAGCTAAVVEKSAPYATWTTQVECLEQRRVELRALTQVLRRADAKTVENAVQSTRILSSPSLCTLPGQAELPVPHDVDAATRARAIREKVADANAQEAAGRIDESLATARAATDEARQLAYAPVLADALLALGNTQHAKGDFPSAATTLEEAVLHAVAGRHDVAALTGWAQLVRTYDAQARLPEARRAGAHAEAMLTRLGGQEPIAGMLARYMAYVLQDEGKREEALAMQRRSLAIFERLPDRALDVARAHHGMSAIYGELNRPQDALVEIEAARAIYEQSLGPAHPHLINALSNKASALFSLGHTREAVETYALVVEKSRAAFGPTHHQVGRHVENLARALDVVGDVEGAKQRSAESLEILRNALGPDHPRVVQSQVIHACMLATAGDVERANALLSTAERASAQMPPPLQALAKMVRGQIDLALGDVPHAIKVLEAADAQYTELQLDPMDRASVRFLLARALAHVPSSRARAIELGRSARDAFAQQPEGRGHELRQVDAWLASVVTARDGAPGTAQARR